MTPNVIDLLKDPVFLRSVLDAMPGQTSLCFSSDIHPSSQEIVEAEHILLTLSDASCQIPKEEIEELKNRIKSLVMAENGIKNN